ncbi:unnamed protein product [Rhizoctonia solani]|uniref:Uncharacterized protein n=1 Tax=Rhizoctonia solani TaxID=456999 RepID=A0A8H2WE45_9AGAM|nr:unnamed protein product [Rhizoctonia solani]
MGNVCAALRSIGRAAQRAWNTFYSWASQPHIRRRFLIAAAVGAGVAILVPLTITTMGFGPAGVAAGSAAAAWQSAAYGGYVAAGRLGGLAALGVVVIDPK